MVTSDPCALWVLRCSHRTPLQPPLLPRSSEGRGRSAWHLTRDNIQVFKPCVLLQVFVCAVCGIKNTLITGLVVIFGVLMYTRGLDAVGHGWGEKGGQNTFPRRLVQGSQVWE